jgi:Protein of unknown function (DUF3421)
MKASSLIIAGLNFDGEPLVIARCKSESFNSSSTKFLKIYFRAHCSGDLMPGKGLIKDQKCHVSYDGKTYILDDFEVLLNTGGFSWQYSSDGEVPSNAVVGGQTSENEPLYVGRAVHEGLVIPGKVHKSHECLYLPHGKEECTRIYEVLVKQNVDNVDPQPHISASGNL